MIYQNTCMAGAAAVLPPEVVTSEAIETQLSPLYRRLRLPLGRLELMTGIRERRQWPRDMMPSRAAAMAGEKVLRLAGFAAHKVDALFNCSVSRDFVEPATSSIVHQLLKLPKHTINFDLSNACLGVLSGMVVAAGMIEGGQINSALLVAGENARPLMETTINTLNRDQTLTRRQIKPMFASLTIGSAAAAVLLCHRSLAAQPHRLLGGSHFCDTSYNHLCQGNADAAMDQNSQPLMQTEAEELLVQGVEVARQNWQACKRELNWHNQTPDLICTHQVGRIHRQRMYQALGLDASKDFATVEFLGNCGSAALPATLALALEQGKVQPGDRIALLGIGSGINSQMLGLQW